MRVQIPLQRIKTDSLHKLDPHRLERLVFGQGVADGTEHALLLDEFRDRKSTRLNSSHGSISYAVFCLKKKKQTTSKTQRQTKQIQYKTRTRNTRKPITVL